MEENQKQNENIITGEIKPLCKKHTLIKCIFFGIVVFLGAFCAFYVVADWHFKTMMRMKPYIPYEKRIDDLTRKEISGLDSFIKQESKIFRKNSIIHMQNNGGEYKIIVDLRAFDNNENNIKVSTNGNILTLTGRSIRKSKHDEQISEFQQNYLFGNNVKLGSLTKETNGNYYIITIPIQKIDTEED